MNKPPFDQSHAHRSPEQAAAARRRIVMILPACAVVGMLGAAYLFGLPMVATLIGLVFSLAFIGALLVVMPPCPGMRRIISVRRALAMFVVIPLLAGIIGYGLQTQQLGMTATLALFFGVLLILNVLYFMLLER